MRAGYGELVSFVAPVSGAEPSQIADFFARGLLVDLIAAVDSTRPPAPWPEPFSAAFSTVAAASR